MISKHRIYSNIHRYGGMHPYSHMRITYSEAHQNTYGYSRHNKHTYTWTHAQIQGTHTSAHLDTHISETHRVRDMWEGTCAETLQILSCTCVSHTPHIHMRNIQRSHQTITRDGYANVHMHSCMLKSMKSVCLPKKKKGHFIIKLRPFQVRVGIRARRNGGGVPLPSTGIHQLKYSQWGSLELAHKSVLRTRDSL